MKILAFGEILWDIFLSQNREITKKKIGGAPFNFAAHCSKLGAESYIISAVGGDENGYCALEEAKKLGLNTDFVSVLPQYQTGFCKITLDNGLPNYDLVSDVAYDHIPAPELTTGFDAFYMGTLAMRNEESKTAFREIVKRVSAKEILFDVNFRKNFYSRELVEELLSYTTILKISDEEIGFFGKGSAESVSRDIAKGHPKIKYICLTLGKDGASVFDCKNNEFYQSENPKSKPVSTVGAGDSFAAAFLVNLLKGEAVEVCLSNAVKLSDFVVTQMGAVPDYSADLLFAELGTKKQL